MPAILRIFVYQTDASHTVRGSTQSYEVIVGHRVDLHNGMWVCNIMRFCRWVYAGVAVAFGPVLNPILSKSIWCVWFDPGGW